MQERSTDGGLDERECARDPFEQFARWFADWQAAAPVEPNAMTLATVDGGGQPSARVVLLKGVDPQGFVFFTNYESRKAGELASAARAGLLFYWDRLHRQVRLEGRVERVSAAESDEYFATRPRGSQVGAWASPQSRPLAARATLEAEVRAVEARFGTGPIPRPPHWGGFRLRPERFEFWQGRESRLHDRIVYTRSAGGWSMSRIAP
jgi:pyridoxamine 5'-phosphate oxidase